MTSNPHVTDHQQDRIAGVEPVPGRKELVRVVLASGPALEVTLRDWTDGQWRVGQALSAADVAALEERAACAAAMERALRWMAQRPRTSQEVYNYLQRQGVAEAHAGQVVRALTERGWVDDQAYAAAFVEAHRGRWSRAEMAWRLRQRGVSRECIDAALSDASAREAEAQAALKAAWKYWRRHSHQPPHEVAAGLVAHLLRRGFSRAVALRVVRQVQHEQVQHDPSDPTAE
ncbi:MAG: regulatory protein RecX [Alicyclobacillaceae bacterium]|nr:regulatory protein RecX [Alicyclobacillaceae bacterium]